MPINQLDFNFEGAVTNHTCSTAISFRISPKDVDLSHLFECSRVVFHLWFSQRNKMKKSFLTKVFISAAGLLTVSLWAFTFLMPPGRGEIDTPRPSYALPTQEKQVALWFGDSFVEGAGASKPSKGFGYRVSQHFGLFHKNLSEGASGYVGNREVAVKRCGQEDCLSLIKILEKPKMLKADVIFVQAGLNDYALSPENSYVIEEFYKKLRTIYPSSIVISLSATKPVQEDDLQKRIKYLAKRSVTQIGGYFIDLGEPFVGHPEWLSADDFHPNDAGYEMLANAVIEKISPILNRLLPAE
jgi:acyl-CoA thioesterase-1